MINSYDKDKFKIGQSYWTFYIDQTGVFEVKPISYDPKLKKIEWDIIGGPHYNHKIKEKALVKIMNGNLTVSCNFYETEDAAIFAHDEKICDNAKDIPLGLRDEFYKLLVYQGNRPKNTQSEMDALSWWATLPSGDKKHVRILFGRVPFVLPK